jgi:DNA modification methylase
MSAPSFEAQAVLPFELGIESVPQRSAAENTVSDSAAALRQIDWTFLNRARPPKVESIHPYPAKFIGDIPAAFLRALHVPKGTAILDPFCGSGTTLVEAQRAGYEAIGVDLNPIACLISRVKTAPLADGFLRAAEQLADKAEQSQAVRPFAIPNVDHWFKKDVQKAVGALASELHSGEFSAWSDALRLALSSILVRVSNQDSDTRYAAVEKDVGHAEVFNAFRQASRKLNDALAARDWRMTKCSVIESDVLRVEPTQINKPVGCVITSPPYPNAYEYWLYHKYRMWWLGFDPLAVKEQEIGARAHFFKKNHHTAEMFEDQMHETLSLVRRVLVDGGHLCVVVGRSKIHGQVIDNGTMLYELARRMGFTGVDKFDRVINQHRKSFNLSHANIRTESVLVLQK